LVFAQIASGEWMKLWQLCAKVGLMLGAGTSSSALSAKRDFDSMIFLETLRLLPATLRMRTSALPGSRAGSDSGWRFNQDGRGIAFQFAKQNILARIDKGIAHSD
jgi:hypothetical protein